MSSDPAIFDAPDTAAGSILRWCIGFVPAPIGFLLIVSQTRDVTAMDVQRAAFLAAPLLAFLVALTVALKLPFLGWLLGWISLIGAAVLNIGLVLLGIFTLVSFPAGVVGLICCFGIAKALERTGEDGLYGRLTALESMR